MTIAFTPPVDPAPGSSEERQYPAYEARFATYRQVAPRGTIVELREVQLLWPVLTPAQLDAILAQLDAAGAAETLRYTLPWETTSRLWRILGRVPHALPNALTRSLTLTLEEAPDPQIP